MQELSQTFGTLIPTIKRAINESLGYPTITYNENTLEYSVLEYRESIPYGDIKKIRVWFGGDPVKLNARSYCVIFLLDIVGREKPLECKQPYGKSSILFFFRRDFKIDLTLIHNIRNKNPDVIIDEALQKYMETGNINFLYETNTAYDDQFKLLFKIMLALLAVLAVCMILLIFISIIQNYL